MEIISQFNLLAEYLRQHLRYDTPRTPDSISGDETDVDSTIMFVKSPKQVEDDRGSRTPITPINSPSGDSNSPRASWRAPTDAAPNTSLDGSNPLESVEIVGVDESPVTLRTNSFLNVSPSKVYGSTESPVKKCKILTKNGLSMTMIPPSNNAARESSFVGSLLCDGDAEAGVSNNLTLRMSETETSSMEYLGKTEARDAFPSIIDGKEEMLVDGGCYEGSNILCKKSEKEVKTKVIITTTGCDEEVELLYCSPCSAVILNDTCNKASSQEELNSLSSSLCPHPPSSTASPASTGSSKSSEGILRPPKRAIGYDPLVNSTFSIPCANSEPQRRVHFSNMSKLRESGNELDRLMRTQALGTVSSNWSNDSTVSLECLAHW